MQLTVLMLEDESAWTEIVKRILSDADIRVTSAFADSDAKSKLLSAAQVGSPVDLVLSDLRHLEVGGIEFLRWLRSLSGDVVLKDGLRARKLPVVILSGSISSETARVISLIDASVGLVSKADFDTSLLLRAVETALTDYRHRVLAEFQDLGMAIMFEGGRYTLTEAYATDDSVVETPYAVGRRSMLGAASRKLILASDRISVAERAIEEFEWLLNKQQTTETDLHRFFIRHPEFLLGGEFAWFWSEPRLNNRHAGKTIRPDFVLQPHEASLSWNWAIVDLKSPRGPLLRKSRFHTDFTAQVHRVTTQLKDYANFFEDPRNADMLRRRFGGYIPKPRLVAIIGRLPHDRDRYADLRKRIPDVYLTTYDELLESRKAQLRRLREVAGADK